MTSVNSKLIADLARLATRYPPEDWEALAASLEDKQRRAQLRALLQELAATSRATGPKSRAHRESGRTARIQNTLDQIRSVDTQRADLLEGVWLGLRQRDLLPTMPMVRSFADATGMKGLTSTKRDQAVGELMEQLVDIPSDELARLLRGPMVIDRSLAEEYERWAHLILGQRGGGGPR